jgi:hypothetical protein
MTTASDSNAPANLAVRDDIDATHRPERKFLARTSQVITGGLRQLTGLLRRGEAREQLGAPPAPRSLIYALCEEYGRLDLWSHYYAFRLDPRAQTWDQLRRQRVPWRRGRTIEELLQTVCPMNGARTPDPGAVGMALTTGSSTAPAPAKATGRSAA